MLEDLNAKREETQPAGSPSVVRCVPVPAWVEEEPYSLQTPEAADNCVANGVCRLLHDTQVNLSGPEHAWHCRWAQRVLTRTGAEHAAHFMVEFNPAHQRLDVHFIRVLRSTERLDHTRYDAFQTFRRETNLERLALDGRITVSLLIPDVRVDDIIETSVTVYGANPVLGGRYEGWMVFDSFHPWIEMRHRLLRPVEREISIKDFNLPPVRSTAVEDGVEVSRWRAIGLKRREAAAFAPPWVLLVPALQFSEFTGWNEIARLFAPHYQGTELPGDLVEEIDRLAALHNEPAERAAEWLRFVQRKLRYFALALGEGGMVPRRLETIWRSGFGDCKDAAQLYIAGARRLGLDACAALTSTTHGLALADFLPMPRLFNHCIVRLRLDNGLSYWLDPTMQTQSGRLENIFQPHVGWALPLTVDTDRLERPDAAVPLHYLNCEEEMRFGPKRRSPAELRRHIDYSYWAADSVRNRIANEGTTVYANEMLKDLKATWPAILEAKPVEIHDDQEKNCLTAVFAYEIPDCWDPDEGDRVAFKFADTTFVRELGLLNGTQRQEDVYLSRPRKVTRYLRMNMPCGWSGVGWSHEERTLGLSLVSKLDVDGRTISHSKELVVDAWAIPAAKAAAYNRIVLKLHENLLTIRARERLGKLRPLEGRQWHFAFPGVGTALVVFWLIMMLLNALSR